MFILPFCRHLLNCALLKTIQQQQLARVCKMSLFNDYARRSHLIEHAERCDGDIGDGTFPKILPCCNRSSLEMMCQNEWKSMMGFANHIGHCGGTTKPPGKRSKTEDNAEHANPNRLHK